MSLIAQAHKSSLADMLCSTLSRPIFDNTDDSGNGSDEYDDATYYIKSDKESTVDKTKVENPHYDLVNYEICCLLAEGSSTSFVSNFASMIELYDKIAQTFDISAKEIMYCTLNTPKVDMDQILSGQICLNDIIFVHRKGKRKHVEVTKTEKFLGLTIADNGNGCCYIKKIKENSTASRVPFIKIGDHIESIMGHSMVGCRHFEVARFLKNIPLDQIFTINLIEPISSNLEQVAERQPKTTLRESTVGSVALSGTLRFRERHVIALGTETLDQRMQTALQYINKQLEKFIGINDDELAEELWHMAIERNPHEFALAVANSDLSDFKFTEDFVFDIWAIVDDVLNGRLA